MQGPPAASNASLQRQSAGTCFEGVSQGVFQGVSPSVKGSVPIAHSNASHRPPRQHDLLFISTIITPSSSLPFCSLLFSLSLSFYVHPAGSKGDQARFPVSTTFVDTQRLFWVRSLSWRCSVASSRLSRPAPSVSEEFDPKKTQRPR